MASFNLFKIGLGLFLVFLTGCFTPRKEKEIGEEFHQVKTRLLELERVAVERGATTDASTKRLASTHTELERVTLELQRIRGDLDAIKQSAATGEVPGADPEADSVAKRLRDLTARVETLELAGTAKAVAAGASAAGSNRAVSVKEIKDAFNSKRFSYVAANADGVLARLKTKNTKEEIAYFGAESLFRLNRYRDAALKFNDFTEQFPASQRLTHVKMRLGDSFKQLGDVNAAKSYYREVLSKSPDSAEAGRARENLEALGEKDVRRKTSTKTKLSNATKATDKAKL